MRINLDNLMATKGRDQKTSFKLSDGVNVFAVRAEGLAKSDTPTAMADFLDATEVSVNTKRVIADKVVTKSCKMDGEHISPEFRPAETSTPKGKGKKDKADSLRDSGAVKDDAKVTA